MVNTYKPKHVVFRFNYYCEDCPYSDIDIKVERYSENPNHVIMIVCCNREEICEWVENQAYEEAQPNETIPNGR